MILVFKTNIQTEAQIAIIKPYLNSFFLESEWNFDLEDCDNILRIESESFSSEKIIELLQNQNFECIELQ